MAKTQQYKITYQDGSERFRNLDESDAKRFKRAADNDRSSVKSVAKGSPTPSNKGS